MKNGEYSVFGNLLNDNVYETIFKGFYPPLHDTAKHFSPDDWFNSYVDTYLDLDVESQINYSNLSVFKKFIQIFPIKTLPHNLPLKGFLFLFHRN